MVDKDKPNDKNPMTLKKEGGNWKVDLNSMPPEFIEMGKSAKKSADAIDEVTKGVGAGKYAMPLDAMMALQKAMSPH